MNLFKITAKLKNLYLRLCHLNGNKKSINIVSYNYYLSINRRYDENSNIFFLHFITAQSKIQQNKNN